MEADGHSVQISTGDVDTIMITHALQCAVQGHEVNVVVDHHKQNTADIFFLS